jgi:thioredoxin-related protein
MKFLLVLLLALGSLHAASLGWQRNYETALAKAKSEEKALMVYLYLPHCNTCNYMNKNVFSDKKVIDCINRNYVAVKLYPNDKSLPKKLQSEISPVFYLINPQNAEMIESVMGGKNAEKFLNLLEESYDAYKTETQQQ